MFSHALWEYMDTVFDSDWFEFAQGALDFVFDAADKHAVPARAQETVEGVFPQGQRP